MCYLKIMSMLKSKSIKTRALGRSTRQRCLRSTSAQPEMDEIAIWRRKMASRNWALQSTCQALRTNAHRCQAEPGHRALCIGKCAAHPRLPFDNCKTTRQSWPVGHFRVARAPCHHLPQEHCCFPNGLLALTSTGQTRTCPVPEQSWVLRSIVRVNG